VRVKTQLLVFRKRIKIKKMTDCANEEHFEHHIGQRDQIFPFPTENSMARSKRIGADCSNT